ncbi:MAG: hypothetical protein K8T10_02565 [Candidatus Eremiobacteraeota bacterium]|nr:hypothetical protein [Candidatus Eremiobacteraeota bacterium]
MFGITDKAGINIKVPQRIIMEDVIDCVIEITPFSKATLRKIEVELFCRETAISRGTSDRYYRKTIYSDLRTPRNQTEIRRGRYIEIREAFQLPPLTTPSFYCRNHMIEWFIRVRLDVPWWPDTRVQELINILPFIVVPDLE